MTDKEIVTWVEKYGAQIWANREIVAGGKGKGRGAIKSWVCQVMTGLPSPNDIIQPTKPTLREAVTAAKQKYEETVDGVSGLREQRSS